MYATIEQLKQYKKYKVLFARRFNANESTVQKCVNELIEISKLNENILTAEIVVTFINDNPTCDLKRIFDELQPQTEEEKVVIITQVLQQIPILIGIDNKVYNVSELTDPEPQQ